MNPLFLKYKRVICVLAVFILLSSQILSAQEKGELYPELHLYRQTLNQESVKQYQQTLSVYKNTPQEVIHYSNHKKFCEQYHQLSNLPDSTAEQLNYKIEGLRHLSAQAGAEKEIGLELKSLTDAFELAFWKTPVSYSTAFILALELESILDRVTDEEYSERRICYFKLGEAYYLFNEFEKSIDVLKESISEQAPSSFTDRTNLDSRRIIGICYANIGQIDTSDYYFRSILESQDMVLDRPIYNAYALSYLGCNAMIRGQYDKALELDSEVLPLFRSHSDYGHLAGMYYCRAQCYAATKDMQHLQVATDSILYFANQDTYNRNKRRKQAFTMLARYHALRGDAEQTKAYSDSLVNIYRQEANEYTSQYIANANQDILNRTIEQTEQKANNYRNRLIYSLIAFIIITLTFVYIIYLYRCRQVILKQLVEKNIKLAQQSEESYDTNTENQPSGIEKISKEEKKLMLRIKQYIVKEKKYRNPNLSLSDISVALKINRTYLSRAINCTTKDSFKAYINQLRIYEAIKIMNANKKSHVSLDELALQVGFSSRTTFFINFKRVTGINPSEFKKNIS